MTRFVAFALAGALAVGVGPAVAGAGSAPAGRPALRHVAHPFVHAGIVFAPPRVYAGPAFVAVAPPIPVPRVEVVSAYPGYGYVWVPGYWGWGGGPHGYHWVRGGWFRPPRYGANWVPPYWSRDHGGQRWVDGHWSYGGHHWGGQRRIDGHLHGGAGRGWQQGHR